MNEEFEQKWEQFQLVRWKIDASRVKDFFSSFDVEIESQYNKLFGLDYSVIQPVIYLVGKIEKMMSVCNFLDTLAENNNEDVDKIKIFQLISHCEISMSTFCPFCGMSKAEKVDSFFEPVKDRLSFRLRLILDETKKLEVKEDVIAASKILYKMRNEYAHQGNFTGRIFKLNEDGERTNNIFSFDWDVGSGKVLPVYAETNLTYKEFLNIYFSAFKMQLENYSSR